MPIRGGFRAGSSSGWRLRGRLAMRPSVLLFDEPTSALDPELRREVSAGDAETWRRRG